MFGYDIGFLNSLLAHDYDNDGIDELFGRSNFDWYILKYNPVYQNYQKVFNGPANDDAVEAMELFDVNGDNIAELLIGRGETVIIYNLVTLTQIVQLDIGQSGSNTEIRSIKYGDIDNDGIAELAVSTEDYLKVFDTTSFTEKFTINDELGFFDIGNVDGDPEIETVISNGSVWEIDNTGSFAEEYNLNLTNPNTRAPIELHDTDNDLMEEAIVLQRGRDGSVYDVEQEALKFVFEDLRSESHLIFDVDGDGNNEILIGSTDRKSALFSLNDGSRIWELGVPESAAGTTGSGHGGLAIGDFDGDNDLELARGVGHNSTGSDILSINDLNTFELEWRSRDPKFAYYAIEIADIDGDSRDEIIAISYDGESHGAGILSIFDYETKTLEYEGYADLFDSAWEGIQNLEIYDYNSDGDLDIIVAADDVRDGKIWVIDGSSYTIERVYEYDNNSQVGGFSNLEVTDIDRDGEVEL